MKKRIISLLLAFMMVISLAPAALAAPGETPPYSLKYLDGIEGAFYSESIPMDDSALSSGEPCTQRTIEIYDVSFLYLDVLLEGGEWVDVYRPFRLQFIGAGFNERTYSNDYGETEYYFENGLGDLFVIWGQQAAAAHLGDVSAVMVSHTYSTAYMSDTQTTTQPSTPSETQPAAPAATPGLSNFVKSQTYAPGQFADVPAGRWFAGNVQTIYELGLMKGKSATAFGPEDTLTLAEAVVLAARIHSIYNTGAESFSSGSPWYQPYADYAAANGIFGAGSDLTAPATRALFAFILSKSVPASELAAVNSVEDGAIPDLPSGKYADYVYNAVYSLYKAGVLTGSDESGSFKPDSTINRAEAAAIVTRVVLPSLRKTGLTMKVQPVTLYASGDRSITVMPSEVAAYEAQGWSRTEPVAVARSTPIRIYANPTPSINSADGVSFYIYWNNHSDKAIKYIHFYITPYNRVNDALTCDIRGYSNADCYLTGPFYKVSANTDWTEEDYFMLTSRIEKDGTVNPALYTIEDGKYHSFDFRIPDSIEHSVKASRYDDVFIRYWWDCMWYNNQIDHLVITKVVIEYMDGTSATLTGAKLNECFY